MNENLNISKILKNAPKGVKLWSPIYGDCEFVEIKNDNSIFPIVCKVKVKELIFCQDYVFFTAKGEYSNDFDNTECVLFPSRENRDWSTFPVEHLQHKHFEPFQKILFIVNDNGNKIWTPDFYSHYNEVTDEHYVVSGFIINSDDEIMPYEGNENMLGKKVK